MKIGVSFTGMDISAKGMTIQRKKMDLISDNIANSETTRMEDGLPYRRKVLRVTNMDGMQLLLGEQNLKNLKVSGPNHYTDTKKLVSDDEAERIRTEVLQDASPGDIVYMPNHPDANEEGYVQMPNINVVTEMVDMIAATRGFEANMTAFNSQKQMAKDALEI